MATTTEASSHSSSSSSVITTTLRLPDQGRARKQCDPIQFSFHDLDFLCVDTIEFILLIRLAKATRHSQRFAGDPRGIGRREKHRDGCNVARLPDATQRRLRNRLLLEI